MFLSSIVVIRVRRASYEIFLVIHTASSYRWGPVEMDADEKTSLVIPVERSRSHHVKRVQAPVPRIREKGAGARLFRSARAAHADVLHHLLHALASSPLLAPGLARISIVCRSLPVIASLESSGTFERAKLQDFDIRLCDSHPIGRLSYREAVQKTTG